MKVGIPKGLLYYKYIPFFETFFSELGCEIITSEDTSKEIVNAGVKYCVDEACLPIKVFHGHVAGLRDKCDLILVPRIMSIREGEFICPKFCGLPEMISNSIPDMPVITKAPIYTSDKAKLYSWAKETGAYITKDKSKIKRAFQAALKKQSKFSSGIKDKGFKINVALVGHPYNIYDSYVNMNLVKKLNTLGVGVITEEHLEEEIINHEVSKLFKRPFWTFARNTYGFTVHMANKRLVDGVVYISSFACGLDSVIIELIKEKADELPFLILKIDEHTGEAGFDTRVEAFADMLERRVENESYISTLG